ncbi:UDP:flavonoid glycosyltransferase YjiC (YdhE family) [Kitasatospora kifunensis]|uniref:UDP:flavonoid glycosyltransferase YjiC (YdhE family) n=1 Tax=Kitasatospora kifunensis TaxID=58351 RepID=A0A7W7QXM5_KITKI|nr:UDP:flavonoid glycosyltransferase YjiC (YdhE family) [Kitasatospora kifunensis]
MTVARFLFVVPPLVGHVNPAVGVAAELAARGHVIAWAGVPELVHRLAGPDAEVFPCAVPEAGPGGTVQRPPDLRGPAALKFLWADFLVPLAEAMAPGVLAAVERFRPDVLVVDQQAVAGALVAERLGLPWATSATTSAEFTGALEGMPLVDAWISGLLTELRSRLGDPAGSGDPRFSPHLILAFTTLELTGPIAGPAGPIRFVGPALTARPTEPSFPWEWLDPERALVLVTLGTANTDAGVEFLTVCQEALRERSESLQAVIVDPGGVLDGVRGSGPRGLRDGGLRIAGPALAPDILVSPAIPQLHLLKRAAAVVCHAGHNTVCEALWYGVPLVVAPIRDDQPVVAAQVVAAGAGVRVRFGRTRVDRLGQALDSVLTDPAHRAGARRVGASFRAAGGAARAASHLEELTDRRSAL